MNKHKFMRKLKYNFKNNKYMYVFIIKEGFKGKANQVISCQYKLSKY